MSVATAETGSHYVARIGNLMPGPLECYGYRHESPCSAAFGILKEMDDFSPQ